MREICGWSYRKRASPLLQYHERPFHSNDESAWCMCLGVFDLRGGKHDLGGVRVVGSSVVVDARCSLVSLPSLQPSPCHPLTSPLQPPPQDTCTCEPMTSSWYARRRAVAGGWVRATGRLGGFPSATVWRWTDVAALLRYNCGSEGGCQRRGGVVWGH